MSNEDPHTDESDFAELAKIGVTIRRLRRELARAERAFNKVHARIEKRIVAERKALYSR